MVVWVDEPDKPYGRMLMAHLISDDECELHRMADTIGVARRWHQGDHYDISKSKRSLAIRAGAVPVSNVELGRLTIALRRAGAMPSKNGRSIDRATIDEAGG